MALSFVRLLHSMNSVYDTNEHFSPNNSELQSIYSDLLSLSSMAEVPNDFEKRLQKYCVAFQEKYARIERNRTNCGIIDICLSKIAQCFGSLAHKKTEKGELNVIYCTFALNFNFQTLEVLSHDAIFFCNLERNSSLERCKIGKYASSLHFDKCVLHISNILHNLTSLESRIALQVARKIASCDMVFSFTKLDFRNYISTQIRSLLCFDNSFLFASVFFFFLY